jgi:hypothetical protein
MPVTVRNTISKFCDGSIAVNVSPFTAPAPRAVDNREHELPRSAKHSNAGLTQDAT